MITVETEASIYEIEPGENGGRIRRTTSVHGPTPNQPGGRTGRDGDWKDYLQITPWPSVIGKRLTITWGIEAGGDEGPIVRRTETSPVQHVEES